MILQPKQPLVSCEFGPIHLLRSYSPKLKEGEGKGGKVGKGREVREGNGWREGKGRELRGLEWGRVRERRDYGHGM